MAAKKSKNLNPIYEAAFEVQSFCLSRNWKLCFIGGLAVQRWGEPRVTLDADLTLLTGFGDEDQFIQPLLAAFAPRLPHANDFARANRILLLTAGKNIPIDIALGALPFEENAVARASRFEVGNGRFLLTCSAEDLIVHKAFANRTTDWSDIERILLRQRGKLDFELIWRELIPLLLLKEMPETADQLRALIVKTENVS